MSAILDSYIGRQRIMSTVICNLYLNTQKTDRNTI